MWAQLESSIILGNKNNKTTLSHSKTRVVIKIITCQSAYKSNENESTNIKFCLLTDHIMSVRAVNMCGLSGVMIHVTHSVTDLVHAAGVFEENEAEASGSASVGVHLDGAVRHLAKLTEVILQVLFTRVPAEAAHEHFTGNSGTSYS